jgi:hypothetical protein
MAEEKPKWFQTLLTPQTVIYICVGLISIVTFWIKTQESWAKAAEVEKKLENKADKIDVQSNRDDIDVIRNDVEQNTHWIEREKGRQQGIQESKK